uniref:Uncharacterized protein n=1 Tax=Dulem virus 39 TaxID=3145757 RepID=A0AAU8B5H2_9CAUD
MLTCRLCGCYCDPSDLINGVCDDCKEAERKEAERKEEQRKQEINRLMRPEYRKLELEDIFYENI